MNIKKEFQKFYVIPKLFMKESYFIAFCFFAMLVKQQIILRSCDCSCYKNQCKISWELEDFELEFFTHIPQQELHLTWDYQYGLKCQVFNDQAGNGCKKSYCDISIYTTSNKCNGHFKSKLRFIFDAAEYLQAIMWFYKRQIYAGDFGSDETWARSIDLEFLYHLEVKWKPLWPKGYCKTFALQFGSHEEIVCVHA